MHGSSNQDTQFYLQHTGQITNGVQIGRTIRKDYTFISDTSTHALCMTRTLHDPGLTTSTPESDVYDPVCINGAWPSRWPVSVKQKMKPATTLTYNVQPIDHMECIA